MNETAFIIQNRLREATVSLERAGLIRCGTELLTATAMPVSSIAEALGFASQFYFSNFFKKQTGMTPSQYRAIYRREHV